jgi:endo-1,4-beta-xylanase
MLTAENVMKFGPIHPRPDEYNFRAADDIVDFAEANHMQVRGHTLVWHIQLPEWLTHHSWTREELLERLRDHITTVVSRYRGRIAAWDVVNEAVDDDGSLRKTIWLEGIGPEYIELAFQWAHEADPEALLFYNDYGAEGMGSKSDAVYNLVKDLVSRDVPIHGVGMQFHANLQWDIRPSDLEANISRLSDLGLMVHITEMDVRIEEPVRDSEMDEQAHIYHQVARTCLATEACQALVFWGFTDKYSWIPYILEGWGSALLLDESYDPKPAYKAIVSALTGN